MNIISLPFFCLLAGAALAYWLVPQRFRYGVLLLASLSFVWLANGGDWVPCVLMAGMLALVWGGALGLGLAGDRARLRKGLLALVLVLEFGLLLWLKNSALFGGLPQLARPLGISWFTLSIAGYLIDVYRGKLEPQKNPLKFLLFGTYFPLLVSGPVVRYGETGAELFRERQWDFRRFCFGLQRMLWGLLKKLVIAERLGILVSAVCAGVFTGEDGPTGGLYVWAAVFCFVIQLYMDFSGCIDILGGASELFGIKLPNSFDFPFVSRSIPELLRRWNASLYAWLKDYVLDPIQGAKPWKTVRRRLGVRMSSCLALLAAGLLAGLWHSAEPKYLLGMGIWPWLAAAAGIFLAPMGERVLDSWGVKRDCFSWRLLQRLGTFLLFALGLVSFLAPDLASEGTLFKAGFSAFDPWIFFDSSMAEIGLSQTGVSVLCLALLAVGGEGLLRLRRGVDTRAWMAEQNLYFRWLVWLGLCVFVAVFGIYGPELETSAFIYGRF